MTKEITVTEGQTIMDIAVQHCGDVNRISDIIATNNIITENDVTGAEIDLSFALIVRQKIVINEEWASKKVIKELNQNIATAEI